MEERRILFKKTMPARKRKLCDGASGQIPSKRLTNRNLVLEEPDRAICSRMNFDNLKMLALHNITALEMIWNNDQSHGFSQRRGIELHPHVIMKRSPTLYAKFMKQIQLDYHDQFDDIANFLVQRFSSESRCSIAATMDKTFACLDYLLGKL